jgi:hypothetical protein
MDSVNFWGGFGGLVEALGLFPGAMGVAKVTPKWSGLPSNGWFDVALAFWAVGLLALLRMAWLRTAHLHAEGHRCPDPEAHSERPRRPEDIIRRCEGVVSGSLPPGRPSTSVLRVRSARDTWAKGRSAHSVEQLHGQSRFSPVLRYKRPNQLRSCCITSIITQILANTIRQQETLGLFESHVE